MQHTAVTNVLHTVQTDLHSICNHGLSLLDKPIPRPFCIISQAPSLGLVLLLHFDQFPMAGEVGQAGSSEGLYALEVMLTHELLEQGKRLVREKSGEDKTRHLCIEQNPRVKTNVGLICGQQLMRQEASCIWKHFEAAHPRQMVALQSVPWQGFQLVV